jgi:hypothetical protein
MHKLMSTINNFYWTQYTDARKVVLKLLWGRGMRKCQAMLSLACV